MMMRNRKRLLDTIRNAINNNNSPSTARSGNQQNPLLRCFPIYENQIQYCQQPKTPTEFHQLLCDRIRNAKFRIQIASLYVGCGNDCETELELLDSLRQHRETNNEVQVQILLDHSRALRKVKKKNNKNNNKTTTTGSISSSSNTNSTSSTFSSSAQACYDALTVPSSSSSSSSYTNNNNTNNTNSTPSSPSNKIIKTGVYLFPVLPKILRKLLPSPYNEVAGVFHMKAYVIDNDILLSGANLSSEYFTTRIDRYLYVQNSSPIANWYGQLINVLCTYGAIQYNDNNNPGNDDNDNDYNPESPCSTSSTSTSRHELLFQNLQSLLLDHHHHHHQGDQHDNDNNLIDKDYQVGDPVAYAVPTFQLPQYYLDENCPPSHYDHSHNYFRQDTAIWHSLFEKTDESESSDDETDNDDCSTSMTTTTMRIASAYLNPTPTFLDNNNLCTSNIYLTAGQISHGFRSINKKRMKDWIPVSYQYAAKNEIIRSMNENGSTHDDDDDNDGDINRRVYYYHRPGWTFHAKGLWLSSKKCRDGTTSKNNNNPSSSPLHFSQDDDIWLVSHGSGNFGYRSECRDVESHLLLVLPPGQQSPLQEIVKTEWNDQLCDPQYALSNDPEEYDMNLSPSWLPYLYYIGRPFL